MAGACWTSSLAPEKTPAWAGALERSTAVPSEVDLDRLADLLNQAGGVTLLCGSGCADAHDDAVAFADQLGAPTVHGLCGKQYIEWDNPFDVGMTGLIGFSSGYHAMMSCDTLAMLGTDFPYRNFYPSHGNVVQIDRRGSALGKRAPLKLGLVGDVKATLQALLPRLTRKTDRRFLDNARKHYADTRKDLDDPARPPIRDARFIRNTSPASSIKSPTKTRCSPPTSARRRCGPRAI